MDEKEQYEAPAEEHAGGMVVLDGGGQVIDQVPDATWDALCELPPVQELPVNFGPKYGRMMVKYRPFISFEDQMRLTRQFRMDNPKKRDTRGFMVAVLKKIMVAPRIQTAQHEQLVLKANFAILNKLIGDTVGTDSEEMEAIRSDLGN